MTIVRHLAIAATLAASALGSGPALADQIDARQARQHHRIEQGLRSGELTRGEVRGLMAEQRGIAELERRARRDGHVDRIERREIGNAQNRASRHIFAERHDGDVRLRHRWPRYGYWGARRWWE